MKKSMMVFAGLLLWAGAAQAQDTLVVKAGESATVTITVTASDTPLPPPTDTTFICPEDWTCTPPDSTTPPPEPVTPLLAFTDITSPTVIPGDQLQALSEGTICVAYDATGGGIFSRDANGQFPAGHLTIWFQDGFLEVRSQDGSTTHRVRASGAQGKHRACYVFGPSMRLFVDGNIAGTGAHDGSMLVNDLEFVLGAQCVQCRPDNRTPSGALNGTLELLEVYDFPMSDSTAAAWSFFEDSTALPPPAGPPGTLQYAVLHVFPTPEAMIWWPDFYETYFSGLPSDSLWDDWPNNPRTETSYWGTVGVHMAPMFVDGMFSLYLDGQWISNFDNFKPRTCPPVSEIPNGTPFEDVCTWDTELTTWPCWDQNYDTIDWNDPIRRWTPDNGVVSVGGQIPPYGAVDCQFNVEGGGQAYAKFVSPGTHELRVDWRTNFDSFKPPCCGPPDASLTAIVEVADWR